MDYEHFSVADFIADEYFIEWVREPNGENSRFWKEWLSRRPEKKACIEEARQAVLQLADIDLISLPSARLEEMKEAIDKRIEGSASMKVVTLKRHGSGQPGSRLRSYYRIYSYAAAVAGILLLSAAIYFSLKKLEGPFVYATDYGETKTLTLPDHSKVILNAHSEIRYERDWKDKQIREVWLRGEAFFSVESMKTQRKFIVHTNDLSVEVLGTKFNVNNRESKTRVVLNSGRIKLSVPLQEDTCNIIMQPGELIQYSGKDRSIVKETVKAGNYISWINNELVLDNTPLGEISETLENNYGITMILIDEGLAARTITATLPTTSLDFILKAISETLNVKITERGENVYILKKLALK